MKYEEKVGKGKAAVAEAGRRSSVKRGRSELCPQGVFRA